MLYEVITPSGRKIGNVTPDGKVNDLSGNYLGKVLPDGVVKSKDGRIIAVITSYSIHYTKLYEKSCRRPRSPCPWAGLPPFPRGPQGECK